jgi:hypothetical protein
MHITNTLLHLGVEATSGNEKWFVGGVYKPPSISNEYFYTEFGQTVDKIISKDDKYFHKVSSSETLLVDHN